MPPEQPSTQPREDRAAPPDALENNVNATRKVLGIPQPLPESMNEAEMNDELNAMREDATYGNLSELLRFNQLLYRKNALQRQAQVEKQEEKEKVNEAEFITVNQGETFFEYYQSILSHTLETADDYLALRRTVTVVPPDVLRDERQAEIFMTELTDAMQQRLQFSNASLVSYLLSVQRDRTGRVMQNQTTLTLQLEQLKNTLDPAGKAALTAGDAQAMRIHANALDQRIITLIAEKGHLSSQMLLALQAQRFSDILSQQTLVIKGAGLARERAEWEGLSSHNKRAREGKAKPLTDEQALRFQQLRELLERAMPHYSKLSNERKSFSDAMIVTADKLSAFHEQSLELLILQHQFKSTDRVEGAYSPNPDTTPPLVREKIDEVTQMRADFHRERIEAFVGRFDEEVLTISLPEHIEDFSNKTGREVVRHISNAMSYVYTLPAPDSLGIRDYLRGRLAGPLNEAMGWPTDKMDQPFESLTPDERQAIMEKTTSIADAVRNFNRLSIDHVKDSLAVLQNLPPSKNALGEPPRDPLPVIHERITSANVDVLVSEYGLPTVYTLVIQQMNADIGDPESGFLGEVQKFTDSINGTLDVHLDTADALFEQSEEWRRWMYGLLLAALGGAAAGAYLGHKILKSGIGRAPLHAVERLPKLRTAGRVLGPIGIVLIGAELRSVMMRDAKLEALSELDALDAAIELIELKGNKKALRYGVEKEILQNRREAIRIQHNALSLLVELQKRFSKNNNEQAEALKERCIDLERSARHHKTELYKLFPITDYLMTDPAKEEGNIGVNIRNIDDARLRGLQYEKERPFDVADIDRHFPKSGQNVLEHVLANTNRPKDPHNFSDLQDIHEQLLVDASEFLQ